MKRPDLSIIIVNYRTYDLLKNCLQSIIQKTPKVSYEIIVVDNNSKAKSASLIQKYFPEITLIKNQKNLYLTRAINQGLKVIRGRFFLILNSDTKLHFQTLEKMLSLLQKNPQIGLATCAHQTSPKKLDLICSKFPSPLIEFFDSTILGRLFKFKFVQKLLDQYRYRGWNRKSSRPVDALPGSFMIGPKSLVDKIGNFDERFILFYQDINYCHRAKLTGYQIFYNAGAKISHLKARSVSLLDPRLRSSIAIHDMLAYHQKYSGFFAWLFLWLASRVDWLYWWLKTHEN